MKSMPAPESQPPSLSSGHDFEAEGLSDRVRTIQEKIACRAYELFEERGHQHGHDLKDWLRAEAQTLLPIAVETYESEEEWIALVQARR
jgi:hypothetical protein